MSSIPRLQENEIRRKENWLFFRQWLKNPAQLGTIAPVSPSLAEVVATAIGSPDQFVIEVGAGTGRITRALLQRGVPPKKLAAIELDGPLCTFMTETIKEVATPLPHIIHGDAFHLKTLLPDHFKGELNTLISVIPFMYLSPQKRDGLIQAYFDVLNPGGRILHITYNPNSPLAYRKDLNQKRIFSLWFNLPPAFVWEYTQKDNGH